MEQIIAYLLALLSWPNPLLIVVGVIIGMVFGILPGLAGPQAMVLLLPITFSMDPVSAMILLVAVSATSEFGGAITTILLGVPGDPTNAATLIDGVPLYKAGKSGMAIGSVGMASALGGIFSAIILLVALPIGYELVLAFSYPEFFMMALMGVLVIATVTEGSVWKGLTAGALGLLLSTVGMDPLASLPRFTFGWSYLWDGLQIIPVLLGLFAIAESVDLFLQKEAPIVDQKDLKKNLRGIREGILNIKKHVGVIFRSSIIGTIIGIIPGVGASVSQFLAYSVARRFARDKSMFGKGDIRGVIAPESANSAVQGGALIPTIIFGIPGSVNSAILLGALMMHGITPGYKMITETPELIYGIIATLVLANSLSIIVGIALSFYLIRVSLVQGPILGTIIILLSVLGAYAASGNYGDVLITIVFGMLGFAMKTNGMSRTNLIIGLLLGRIAEINFRQTLMTTGALGFLIRPISATILLITVISILYSIFANIKKRKMVEQL